MVAGFVRIATKVIQGFIYLKLNYLSSGAPNSGKLLHYLFLAKQTPTIHAYLTSSDSSNVHTYIQLSRLIVRSPRIAPWDAPFVIHGWMHYPRDNIRGKTRARACNT